MGRKPRAAGHALRLAMRFSPMLLLLVACGGGSIGGGGGTAGEADGGMPTSARLVVRGNRIEHEDGTPFHGRGANLHDERSCSACSFAAPSPDGLNRWADELIDGWHANFIRFLLESRAAPFNQFEVQWKSFVDDAAYLADIENN